MFIRRCYHIVIYYGLHGIKISEFNFLDFNVIAILSGVIVALYLLMYEKPLYIGIPSLTTQLYIAENTLRSISLFISIVFAFVILSFNVFYKYFGRLTFTKFFTSRHIRYLFTLFVGDMIFLLYTCGYLKESYKRDDYGDWLFICSLLISAILVFSIIPTLILLLRQSQNRENISTLIKGFNTDHPIRFTQNDFSVTNLQNDTIILLIEIGTVAIKEFDKTTLLTIKEASLKHLKEIHSGYNVNPRVHPNSFYVRLIELCRSLYPVAIKERNEIAAMIIVDFLSEAELFYIRNFSDFNIFKDSDFHYDGISYHVAMNEFLLKSLQFNEDSVSASIIQYLRDWWQLIIEYHFPKIKYEHPTERFSYNKTSFFIDTTYLQISDTFEQIFIYKKGFLYRHVAQFFSIIDAVIISAKNTRSSTVYLLQINGIYSSNLFEKYVRENAGEITYNIYPFGMAARDELLSIKSQVPFKYQLQAVTFLNSQNRLNSFVINDIKTTAFHVLDHYKEDIGATRIMNTIIQKFDQLRLHTESGSSVQQKETYLLLHKYLGYIKEWIPKYKLGDDDVLHNVENVVQNFSRAEQFQTDLESIGYLIKDIKF